MTELALALAIALAAPRGQDPEEAAARAAAVEAKEAFAKGDYAAALAKYEEAYQHKPVAQLLFNLAQCYRQLGNHEKAITYYQRFLDSGPGDDQANATKELLADERDKQRQADAARAAEAEQKRQLELEAARAAVAKAEADVAARRAEELKRRADLEAALKAQPAPPPPSPPVYQRWWFWGGIGAVVAAGVTTGVVLANQPKPTPTTFPDINAR